jgi:hypothetical protein
MKRPVEFALAAVLVLGTAGGAQASSITYEDVFSPGAVYFDDHVNTACIGTNLAGTGSDTVAGSPCQSLAFTHDLALGGFEVLQDSLTSAFLDLYFYDDHDPGNNPEAVRITLDGSLTGEYPILSGSTSSSLFKLNFNVLTQVSSDGLLHVLLERGAQGQGQGDFFFARSVLTAEWATGERTTPVAEPGSLLLLALGMAAAVTGRRWSLT